MIRSILIVSGIATLLMLAVSGWAWGQIPADAQIPIHWGRTGEADGYASKEVGLLLMPLMALGIGALLAFIPRIDPRRTNILRSQPAYRAIAYAVLLLLVALHAAAVVAATGREVDMARIVAVGVGLLFVIVGNYLGKTRSSWFFGIRTPWTLSSERSWALTHRLGGYLFAAFGLVLVVIGFVNPEWLAWVILPGLAVVVGVPVAYSYLVWREDNSRQRMESQGNDD
jgi:uncharacterized membrane protein